jgi:hypothetical protein
MKKILDYAFNFLLILFLVMPAYAQEGLLKEKARIKGPRFGFDLSRLTLYYFEPERTTWEFTVDYELKRNYYPLIEFGLQSIDLEEETYNYRSEGYYFRIGMDYNFQKNTSVDQYEMVFFGFRYSFSEQKHSADNILIQDDYWGDFYAESVPETTFYGHWLELAGGIRAELFRNVFIGWSFRGRLLLYKSKNPSMEPYYIPGFGKGGKRVALGFNYSIYYKIPLFKVKPKLKPIEQEQVQ